MEDNKKEVSEEDDKKHWKLGIFYYNRADKRVFLPKRYGIGWTVNFGKPGVLIVTLALMFGYTAYLIYMANKYK